MTFGKTVGLVAATDSVQPSTVPGCVFLGVATKTAINSAKHEGPFLCASIIQTDGWYAVRSTE